MPLTFTHTFNPSSSIHKLSISISISRHQFGCVELVFLLLPDFCSANIYVLILVFFLPSSLMNTTHDILIVMCDI